MSSLDKSHLIEAFEKDVRGAFLASDAEMLEQLKLQPFERSTMQLQKLLESLIYWDLQDLEHVKLVRPDTVRQAQNRDLPAAKNMLILDRKHEVFSPRYDLDVEDLAKVGGVEGLRELVKRAIADVKNYLADTDRFTKLPIAVAPNVYLHRENFTISVFAYADVWEQSLEPAVAPQEAAV